MYMIILLLYRLIDIQSRIFDLGAHVATPVNNSGAMKIAYTLVGGMFVVMIIVLLVMCICV